jgi:acetolactate synthase small subunit
MSASAFPVSSGTSSPVVSCFSLVAAADPGVLSRVINVFAKRGLIPSQVYSTLVGPRSEDLHIDLQVSAIDAHLRELIAESLRQIVCVQIVLTSEKRRAQSA